MEPVFFWLGRSIGDRQRYKIVKHLHSTRMSSVYVAVDRQTKSKVVIKIADNRFQLTSSAYFLKTEAEVLKSLTHHRIAQLFDCGDLDDGYFLVLERIEGKDLHDYIDDEGPLLPEVATQIVIEALEAVEYIHSRGELHGDLKTGNIMIAEAGGAKLIDFGLSRCKLPGAAGFGTTGCSAPEQNQGINMDVRSDLYSMGVVLYESLTDNSPFFGINTDEEDDVRRKEYWKHLRPFPSGLHVPVQIQEIVWKTLQIDPDLRFQTAKEMREVLLEVLLSLPKYGL